MIGRLLVIVVLLHGASAVAQTTSLGRRLGQTSAPPPTTGADQAATHGNALLEAHSLIAVRPRPPRKIKVHDLITVIVRERREYEADAELESRKKLEVESTLDAFVKFIGGGIGASAFRRGRPNIDFQLESLLRNKAEKEREDNFTARITGEIIDVKPNGTLVFEARKHIVFDNERSVMTLSGVCRSEDVTPDNTVLSSQVADAHIDVQNWGAVRDGARRGWLVRALDFLRAT